MRTKVFLRLNGRFPASRANHDRCIKCHPAASHFLLAVILSWGGILVIVLPSTFPAPVSDAERLFTAVYLAMLSGPSVAGIAVTAWLAGWDGLREYRNRLLAWCVGGGWYDVALLTAPLSIALTLLLLSFVSTDFLPAIWSGDNSTAGLVQTGSRETFLLMGLVVGVGAGFFEELGRPGSPCRTCSHASGFRNGCDHRLVWGAWHFLAIYWGSANAIGTLPVPVYLLVALFSFIVPYRILMTWVHQHTQSTLIGVQMHASLTSSMLILGAPVSGANLLLYDLAFGGILWMAAGVVLAIGSPAVPPSGSRSWPRTAKCAWRIESLRAWD